MECAENRSQELFIWGVWRVEHVVNFATHERGDAINFHNSKVVRIIVALLATIAAKVSEITASFLINFVKEIIHFTQSHTAGRPAPSIGGKSGHVN